MKRSILAPKVHRSRMGAVPIAGRTQPVEEQITINGPASNVRSIRSQAPVQNKPKPAAPEVPDRIRAEKGMSMSLLLKKQPRYMLNSSEDIVIRTLKHAKTKGGMPAITGTSRDLNTKPMRVHKFQVIGMDKSKQRITGQKRIKVSCSCEFFMFYSEYALWTWGAASIRYSNGQPANVRNPGNHPILCKHLVQALETIRKNNF